MRHADAEALQAVEKVGRGHWGGSLRLSEVLPQEG